MYPIVCSITYSSVERIREYLEIEQEAPATVKSKPLPPLWPAEGSISVENLTLRYAPDLPTVIQNVTFKVDPRSKVAIVGRTGAGKSTIATAFFRILEADKGRIVIDNVDISTIGLQDLRSSLAIIPQE